MTTARFPVGTRIGPYEVVELLGAGGMGEVYRAWDTRLGRHVAVKVLPRPAAADPARLRRFENESRAAGALSHPNVLSVFDVGVEGDSPYLVSEFLEGETLLSRMEGPRLTVRAALEYAIQIADGLAAAHEKGVVHRDLKPANLFVTRDGRIKILDFGLAKLIVPPVGSLDATATWTTQAGVPIGTAGYMAPEQVEGREADARADIFAFGAVLYEMLTGRPPFRATTAAGSMAAILRDEPPALTKAAKLRPCSSASCTMPGLRSSAASVRPAWRCPSRTPATPCRSGIVAEAPRASGARGADHPLNRRARAGEPVGDRAGIPGRRIDRCTHGRPGPHRRPRITSRTSAMRYKSTRARLPNRPDPQGGRGRGGLMVRVGDRLRVSARLIDAAADRHQ